MNRKFHPTFVIKSVFYRQLFTHPGILSKLREFWNLRFLAADLALEKRRSMLSCSTGSRTLDELLLGGIETQAVTEFYGEFGSGKSQICHILCATARQPIESGGMDSGGVYILENLERTGYYI
jgi:RecA/RadA recombinase